MNIIKQIEPNTERCGTPLITLATDEKQFSIATHWYLSLTNDEIHEVACH